MRKDFRGTGVWSFVKMSRQAPPTSGGGAAEVQAAKPNYLPKADVPRVRGARPAPPSDGLGPST
jgi:hypothetical protein